MNSEFSDGDVFVMPTDTVYGLVCRAADKEAVERLYRLKEREKKPGTIIAASIDQLVELGIKRRYLTAVEQYWPNSLSIIVPSELALRYLDRGLASLAVRIVADEKTRSVLGKTGPLLTTSTNLAGQPPAKNIQEAKRYFGDRIDQYIDGGDLSNHQPSTLIRIIDDAVEVVREGAVKINEKGEIVT